MKIEREQEGKSECGGRGGGRGAVEMGKKKKNTLERDGDKRRSLKKVKREGAEEVKNKNGTEREKRTSQRNPCFVG